MLERYFSRGAHPPLINIILFYLLILSYAPSLSQYTNPPIGKPQKEKMRSDSHQDMESRDSIRLRPGGRHTQGHPARTKESHQRAGRPHQGENPERIKHKFERFKRPFDTFDSLLIYAVNPNFEAHLAFAKKELEIAKESNDPYTICYASSRMGQAYFLNNYPHLAFELFVQTINLSRKHEYDDILVSSIKEILHLVGDVQHNLKYAEELIFESESLVNSSKLEPRLPSQLQNIRFAAIVKIFKIYEKNGDTAGCRRLIKKIDQMASRLEQQYPDRHPIPYATYLWIKNKPHQAASYLKKAIADRRKRSGKRSTNKMSSVHKQLIQIYLDAHQIDSVKPYLNWAIRNSFAKTLPHATVRADCASLCVNYYQQKGIEDSVSIFMDIERKALRQAYENNLLTISQEYAIKYRSQQKEEKIKAQREANKKQQAFIISLLLGTLLILLITASVIKSNMEKKKANLELAQKNKEISHQSKELEKLSKFRETLSTMIVHDLKTSLSAVINLSRQREISGEKLFDIHRAGKKMLDMVLNILDVHKFQETKVQLHKASVKISDMIHQSIQDLSHQQVEKNIGVHVDHSHDYLLEVDQDLIERVISNILSNAIKYSPVNATINIWFHEDKKGMLKVWIKDQGAGIPSDSIEMVFDKFWQHHSKKMGDIRSVGLGLTFCKLTILEHGGEIGVESELGQGSSFYFTLPYYIKIEEETSIAQNELTPTTSADSQSNDSQNINEEIFAYLMPFLEKIKNYSIRESVDLMTILDQIEDRDEYIKSWKSKMENAVIFGNEEQFETLLNIKT